MTQTFTLDLDFTAKNIEKELKSQFLEIAEPSEKTIQNILNFSRNLEIKKSRFLPPIEVIRS